MRSSNVLVCYDKDRPGMYAKISGMSVQEFMGTSAWRAWMYFAADVVTGVKGDAILFDGSLSFRECQAVLESLQEGEGHGAHVIVDSSFEQYVARKETYIDARSRVGLAIKSQNIDTIETDEILGPKFREFRNVVNAAMTRPLRDRQMMDAFFMTVVGRAADFSVPGSGKTAAVLGVFAYLKYLGKVKRIVVICPKSGFESWEKEWVASFGDKLPLKLFSLGDSELEGLGLERRRRTLELDSGADNLIVLNYESLGNYVSQVRSIVSDQTLLVFDEVHRVKAIGGKRAKAALEVSQAAQFVVALTGTPIPNAYQDIYNLLHIMFPEDYDTFFGYNPGDLLRPSDGFKEEVNERIRPFFCRTSKDDLGVPKPDPDMIVPVHARESENELLHILLSSCSNALTLIVRTLQLESDPRMLAEAIDPEDLKYVLDQVGDKFTDIDYVDFSQEYPALIESSVPSSKTVQCLDLVDSIVVTGSRVIVWCIFVRSIKDIVEGLRARGISAQAIYGAIPQDDRRSILDDYRAGKFQVLVTNPQTLGESVSLHSICHEAVYFEYSYNLVHLLQSKDRIHRLGLPMGQRTRYYFMQDRFLLDGIDFSLDEKIYDRLSEKEQTMLKAIEGDYLEDGYLDRDDARLIFEKLLGKKAKGLKY